TLAGTVDGFGERAAARLVEGIAASRSQPFERVLFGIGIRHVGEKMAEALALHFRSLAALMGATQEDIARVEGVGPERARAIRTFLDDAGNRAVLARLSEAGLQMELRGERSTGGPLSGLSVVITGTLS